MDMRLDFGLGKETSAHLENSPANENQHSLPKLPANRLFTIREGKGILSARKPPFV